MYFDNEYQYERRRANAQRRQQRLEAARLKGTHTKAEWKVLSFVFDACVCCGVPYEDLHGESPTKDHIEPISCDGCDCIGNLQPVCRNCNSRGIYADWRNAARPGWVKDYLTILQAYLGA